jgi:hypothetical protein
MLLFTCSLIDILLPGQLPELVARYKVYRNLSRVRVTRDNVSPQTHSTQDPCRLQPAHAGDTTPGRGVICHRSLGPSLLPTSSAKTVTVISADIIYYNDVGQAFALAYMRTRSLWHVLHGNRRPEERCERPDRPVATRARGLGRTGRSDGSPIDLTPGSAHCTREPRGSGWDSGRTELPNPRAPPMPSDAD